MFRGFHDHPTQSQQNYPRNSMAARTLGPTGAEIARSIEIQSVHDREGSNYGALMTEPRSPQHLARTQSEDDRDFKKLLGKAFQHTVGGSWKGDSRSDHVQRDPARPHGILCATDSVQGSCVCPVCDRTWEIMSDVGS